MDLIKLLLVDDDYDYRSIIKDCLEMTGEYAVYEAKNGKEGYDVFKTEKLDIIVTDVDMPKVSGLEMVDWIRKEDTNIPIVVTSGLTTRENVDEGFKHEIDNYIRKPFQPETLDGYVKALLRRMSNINQLVADENQILPLGRYEFDLRNYCLIYDNKTISLSKRSALILYMLYRSRGKMVKRKEILKEFWGSEDDFFHSRSLDVFINKLRKHLNKDKSISITTLRSEGLTLIC